MFKLYKLVYVVDLIGGGLSCLTFIAFFSDWLPASLTPFFQNFGVEMMGTWISIRVIDYLMLQRSKASATRTRVLRHSRFWVNQVAPFCASINERDMRRLRLEYRYTTHMAPAWSKFLEQSEKQKYFTFVELIGECLELATDIGNSTNRIVQDMRSFAQKIEAHIADIATHKIERKSEKFNALTAYTEVKFILRYIEDVLNAYIHDYEALLIDMKSKLSELESFAGGIFSINAPISVSIIEDVISKKEEYDELIAKLEDVTSDLEADIREETAEE